MKNDWEVKKLEEFCDFGNGLWAGKKPPYIAVGVIRNTNFTKDCELNDSDIICLNVEKSQYDKRKLQFGDIVLEKSGGGPKQPVGRVIIFNKIDGEYSYSNFTSVIKIKNKKDIDFYYLHKYLYFHYLTGSTESMQSHSTGIRNLKFDEYKQINVPLPLISEQQRIVATLDEAFDAIARAKENAEKNLQNARDLFESYLQSVFANPGEGWEEKRLGEIISEMMTGPFGSMLHKSDYVPDGIPVVNPQNIINGEIISLQKTMINQKTKDRLCKYSLIKKDIVIARRGEMGRCAIVTEKEIGWLCGTGCLVIRIGQNADEEFIRLCLSSAKVKELLEKESIGTTMSNLNQGILMQVPIALPPLPEQRSIVAKLNALSTETKKLEAIYQKKLADLEELKKSILKKAFNGELECSTIRKIYTVEQNGQPALGKE
ncbi:MAG: restriction endonuclease subunit S [Parabacteroides sp.]|nr:restriction endonuclease subunit S [Parabacteroides sp.]